MNYEPMSSYLNCVRPDPGPARPATEEEVEEAMLQDSPLLRRQKELIDLLAEFDPWPEEDTDPFTDEPFERGHWV